MKGMRQALFAALCASAFLFTGCSGGDSGTFSPTPATPPNSASSTSATTSFSNISTASGKMNLSLTLDRATVDTTAGQVLATASVTKSDGSGVRDLSVTFDIAAGPATVGVGTPLQTDYTGKALVVITPGDVPATTNVIVEAKTTINGQLIRAYAPFQIVRGTGVMTFITEKKATDPDGTLFTLNKDFDATHANEAWSILQQLPFKLTDANGNPRVGVQVTLSIDNQIPARLATISPIPTTAITDSAGKGIFNVVVTMITPPPGYVSTSSIIYKAVTTEAAGIPPLATYGGFMITFSTAKVVPAALTIIPGTADFGSGSALATIQFLVSGGTAPYGTPVSGSPLITASPIALNDSGQYTFIATCSDPSKLLTGMAVSISVADSLGATASATINGSGTP